MGSYYLDPEGESQIAVGGQPETIVGAATMWQALADNTDASYVLEDENFLDPLDMIIEISGALDGPLPAGAVVTGVRTFIRSSSTYPGENEFPGDRVGVRLYYFNRSNFGTYVDPNFGYDYSTWGYVTHPENDGVIRDKESGLVTTGYATNQNQVRTMHEIITESDMPTSCAMQVFWWGNSYPIASGCQVYVYRVRLKVEYNERPVVVTGGASGNQPTSKPTVSWAYSDPDGDAQTHYQVRVYDAATYGAPGFNTTDTTSYPPAWDSGKVASTGNNVQVPVALTNGTSYKAYARVWHANVAGLEMVSLWDDGNIFTIAIDPPATPIVSVSYANGIATITANARDNLLTYNQSSLESNTTGWVAGASTTVARTTAAGAFLHGSAALSIQRTGTAGTASATTTIGTGGVPVIAGQVYSAVASFKAAATARTCLLSIFWYNSAGTFVNNSNAAPTADTTGGWTQLSVTATAPAGAAFAAVYVDAASAAISEIHYVDRISIAPGSSTTWTRGGLVNASQRIIVERQVGSGAAPFEVVKATTLAATPLTASVQGLTTADVEFPHGAFIRYRVRVSAVTDAGESVLSVYSNNSSDINPPLDSWWLKSPVSGTAMQIRVSTPPKITFPKPMEAGFGIGRDYNVVSHAGLKKAIIDTDIDALDATTYNSLLALLDLGTTLVLVDVLGRWWYVEPGEPTAELIVATKTALEASPIRHAHRISLPFYEVEPT